MKKNIFTLLAEKKSVVVGATLAFTLSLSAAVLTSCNPDNPTPPQPQPPEPQEITYMVSFETNGGSKVDSVEVKENATIVLENYVTTKEDNYFYGWCLDEELTERASATVTVTSNMTLYAEWGEEELYWLNFETGKGSKIQSVQYAPNAYLAIPEEPTRENYSFGGWYKDEACTKEFTFFGAQMPKKDLTVYAKWNTLHGILFETNGGSEVASIFGETGTPVIAPQNPTKDGYVFEGWYADANFTESYEIVTIPSKVVTVYAKWHEQIKDIKVTLHLNHTAVAETTVEVTGDEGENLDDATTIVQFKTAINEALKEQCLEVTDADLAKASIYNFIAWAYDENGTKRFNGELPYAQEIDLYAVWTRSSAYCQVSFEDGNSYFVKKNTAIPNSIIEPILNAATAEYEAMGCKVDGFYTAGGNLYGAGDLVAMDMNLMPYVYSANLVYQLVTKSNGKGSTVTGYALAGYKSEVSEEYKAKEGLLLLIPEYYSGKPVIWVNDNAFADFPVNEVSLPSGLLGIGAEAFKNSKLTEITLPSALYLLGDNAFSGSEDLATVTMNSKAITSLGVTVFKGAAYESKMPQTTNGFIFFDTDEIIIYRYVGTDVTVNTPSTAETIGGGAFKDNTTLKNVILHDNVRAVGDYAFENTALQTASIGKFFASMGTGIFRNSTSLTKVTFASKYNLDTLGVSMFEGCTKLTTISLVDLQNLQVIQNNAFKGCTSLTGIVFPNSLASVGVSAFEGCTALVYADFGTTDASKFSTLSDRAFANCTSLRRIIFRGEIVNKQVVKFGTNVLLGSGYTKGSETLTTVIYVKDKYTDNWSTDDDFDVQTYVEIYKNELSKKAEYRNVVVKAIDADAPNLTMNYNAVTISTSEPSISAFDILAFLSENEIYSASDKTPNGDSFTVSVKSVETQRGILQSTNGKYNLSAAGEYLVTLVAEDEFGNTTEAQIVLVVMNA